MGKLHSIFGFIWLSLFLSLILESRDKVYFVLKTTDSCLYFDILNRGYSLSTNIPYYSDTVEPKLPYVLVF